MKRPAATPETAFLSAAAVQIGLGILSWLIVGFASARRAWLLDASQELAVRTFFFRDLPVLGFCLTVLLPAIWIKRLFDEVALSVTQDTEMIERILAFPRRVALIDMGASAGLFFLGALRLRVEAQAPVFEAAKIEVLGLVTGVLYGLLSYFLLSSLTRPLLIVAVEQGAIAPSRRAFSLTQKIIACCLAIALVLVGLYGEIALAWAERSAETEATQRAQTALRGLAEYSTRFSLRDAASWRSFFNSTKLPAGLAVFVTDGDGHVVATEPSPPLPASVTAAGLRTLEHRVKLAPEPRVSRIGEASIVTTVSMSNGLRLTAVSGLDRRFLGRFVAGVLGIAAEILAICLILAIAAGRGLVRPLRELEERARAFARDPSEVLPPSVPTDDEIGVVAASFVQMEAEIRATQVRLRESERRAATAELLAGVAHEVRNPLFGIVSTAAALRREVPANPVIAEHVSVIEKEGERLSRMIDEMLTMQRSPRARNESVPLIELLESAGAAVRRRQIGREIEFNFSAVPKIVLRDVDVEGLRGVFRNLFENAVLAHPGAASITARAAESVESTEIEIADSGEGVNPRIRERLFEPFVSGRPGGSGMGLAVCRQVLEEHGGTIRLKSAPNEPTMFSVTLPRALV